MGVRRLSKGRKRGGGDDDMDIEHSVDDVNDVSSILEEYYASQFGVPKPITFAALLSDINEKAISDQRADGPAGDLTLLNTISSKYKNENSLARLYAKAQAQAQDQAQAQAQANQQGAGSSRRRKRGRTKKRRSAKRSVKRSVKRSAKRRKARR
jgi:hypothetical protein